MADLLNIDRIVSQFSLIGLSKYGVERFLDIGTGGMHKHDSTDEKLHLLYGIFLADQFICIDRHKSIGISNGLDKTFLGEEFDWQGHVHYGFTFHYVHADLFEEDFQDAFLDFEDLFVYEDELLFLQFPFGALGEEVFDWALVLVDDFIVLGEVVFEVVFLVDFVFYYLEDLLILDSVANVGYH